MKKLDREFFARDPKIVARDLLGKFLVRKIGKKIWVGRIVETESYLGPGDTASHSHRGQTPRNSVMFGPGGFSYVYFTYGMHWLLNFITEEVGKPSGVLIRAVEPVVEQGVVITDQKLSVLKQKGSGPARLTKWMEITGELNSVDITKSNDLFVTEEVAVEEKTFKSEKVKPLDIVAAPRVGVEYSEHKHLLLRFYLKENPFVSKTLDK